MPAVVFQIAVPLASWADTGTNYRPTDLVPTWSAVVGIVGAAFGWRRGADELIALAQTHRPAFDVKRAGQRLLDFHTIQSPSQSKLKGSQPRSRREELNRSADAINTTITKREYLQDVAYDVAIACTQSGDIELKDIVEALNCPAFPLYAGRRSCPLGPTQARLIDGDCVEDWLDTPTHWDIDLTCALTPSLVRSRRDLLERATEPRRFSIRREAVL